MNNLYLKHILLVDDDEISNLFNKIFIGKLDLDVKVDFALNGQQAINILDSLAVEKQKADTLLPCLLLLDIKMPVMDGWGFLKTYEERYDRHIRDNITIVMLTTSEDEGDMIRAMKNPDIKEFIQKPLSEKKFKKLINAYFTENRVK